MNERDTEVTLALMHRAMCLHVEAVKNVIGSEPDPRAPSVGQTNLSADDRKRENQYRHLNWAAVSAFERAGVPWKMARVRGERVEPYRRKGHIDVRHPMLKRVNKIVSRMQDGLLRTLLALDSAEGFETEDGRRIARDLFTSLTEWDYPKVAEILVENPGIYDGLCGLIGLTVDELLEMTEVDCDTWRALGAAPECYETYYKGKSA